MREVLGSIPGAAHDAESLYAKVTCWMKKMMHISECCSLASTALWSNGSMPGSNAEGTGLDSPFGLWIQLGLNDLHGCLV